MAAGEPERKAVGSVKNLLVMGAQSGPQLRFVCSDADIAIYGGAAGGGKTFALLLIPMQFREKRYDAVIFRRTTPQILNPGGLWDEASKLYPGLAGKGKLHGLQWYWTTSQHIRLRVKFAHLEERNTVHNWQGSQVPLICFDELTHFEESQFWYMLSRNRSLTGEAGKVRATTNPDCDSWVAKLVEWYIGEDGYPIAARAGKKRWLVRDGDRIVWGDTKQELRDQYPAMDPAMIMSFTFVPAKVEDNVLLMQHDPAYVTRLNMLPYVDRMRLKLGNWLVRETAGNVFRKDWFEIVDAVPEGGSAVRYWDRAATKKKDSESHDPDWTAGVRVRKVGGAYYVEDVVHFRDTPFKVQAAMQNTAKRDGQDVLIGVEQDPGQAGVSEADALIRLLDGWNVRAVTVNKDKLSRAKPVSAQAEAGNIKLVRGAWNDTFLRELQDFPEGKHDDQVDGLSGAYGMLFNQRTILCA